jgi:hypothetical protein
VEHKKRVAAQKKLHAAQVEEVPALDRVLDLSAEEIT